ncbi:ribonuclease inhibitor-like [Engraulis encrasicolus]|uniref:ribonuclease inhibitor-like n=1 Tax=Engraulis encrasicolus TaxID=184585 RepID=UPI002FD736BD
MAEGQCQYSWKAVMVRPASQRQRVVIRPINLSDCTVTGEGYAALAAALKSNPSHLEELDLRGNNPGHSEVKLLTDLLEDPASKLQRLRLLSSNAADTGLVYLTSVLGGNPLTLTELDLRGKITGDSGVKQFCALLEDSHCRFKKVNLSDCGVTGEGYAALASALKSNPSHLEELDLRGNDPGDSEVTLLTDLLKDPTCKLQRLRKEHFHDVILFNESA